MTNLKKNLDILQKTAKERTVKTQTIEFDLETLVKKLKKKVIKLDPDYQRKHRWSDDVSSRLIESLILNIPIPLVYISLDIDVDQEIDEEEGSRYSIIDGQQRLSAIMHFFSNKYHLTDLRVLKELNGSYYSDLPPFLIRRLEERTIKCLRIDSTADQQVKYDIFERLNTGAIRLEAQELRNAVCRGPFRDLIKELAKNDIFVKIAKLNKDGAKVKKMEDEELVLRYFALSANNGYIEYKKNFKDFLTEKMSFFNNCSEKQISYMKSNFINTMNRINTSFGDSPFAKLKYNEKKSSFDTISSFNAAVFDAVAIPLSTLSMDQSINHDRFKELFKNELFIESISGSVNDASKLLRRINFVKEIFNNE